MSSDLRLVLGGGGHARVLLDGLALLGLGVDGVLDPHARVGELIDGVPVLGGDDRLDGCDPTTTSVLIGVGANPSTERRRSVHDYAASRGFAVASFTHPTAAVSPRTRLGAGVQTMAMAVVHTGSDIGENALINTGAIVEHDCAVGAHAAISPGAVLCGGASVGVGAFVGAGAVVLPGVAIGDAAVIGAGATIARDVPAGETVRGSSAEGV